MIKTTVATQVVQLHRLYDVVRGCDLPADPLVDPNRAYLQKRDLNVSLEAGLIDRTEAGFLKRIDGIVARLPADEEVEPDELVAANRLHTLFPQERAMVQPLFERLLRVDVPANLPQLVVESLSTECNEQAILPKLWVETVDPDKAFALPKSSPEADICRRAKLISNATGNPNTINLRDLYALRAYYVELTPSENDWLETAIERLTTLATSVQKTETQNTSRTLIVPLPGEERLPIVSDGPVQMAIIANTSVTEDRKLLGDGRVTSNLSVRRDFEFEINVPAGHTAVLMNTGSGENRPLGSGTRRLNVRMLSYTQEPWIVELWQGKKQVSQQWLKFPELPIQNRYTSNNTGETAQFGAGGLQIRSARGPLYAHPEYSSLDGRETRFTYLPTAPVNPDPIPMPRLKVKPGIYDCQVYSSPSGNAYDWPDRVQVAVLSSGCVELCQGGSMTPMVPHIIDGKPAFSGRVIVRGQAFNLEVTDEWMATRCDGNDRWDARNCSAMTRFSDRVQVGA